MSWKDCKQEVACREGLGVIAVGQCVCVCGGEGIDLAKPCRTL